MEVIKKHWQIIIIICLATFLRVWDLDSKAILFGDAGHDILSAITAMEEKTVPLLGIESSVPRFKQGPVTVWLHMFVQLFTERDLYWHWLFFALIGVASVIAVYEYAQIYLNNQTALLSSLLIATSPLAVAHSRMAYHITPIPFMMVLFLFAVTKLHVDKKVTAFWAVLAWAGLFQTELALTPLILIVIFILYEQKRLTIKKTWLHIGAGLFIGLLPQILYDLTHHFSHLGGFLLWMVYRVVSLSPSGNHQFSLETIQVVGSQAALYIGRIFSFDWPFVTVLVFASITISIYFLIGMYRKKSLAKPAQIVVFSTLLLGFSYLLHGNPSEAYFPPFIILVPLIASYACSLLSPTLSKIGVAVVIVLAVSNTLAVLRSSFFMEPTNAFYYGYGKGEQTEILRYLAQQHPRPFFFVTTQPAGKFANYFDNLRLVAWQLEMSESVNEGKPIFIEPKDSDLATYPGIIKVPFATVDLYYLL